MQIMNLRIKAPVFKKPLKFQKYNLHLKGRPSNCKKLHVDVTLTPAYSILQSNLNLKQLALHLIIRYGKPTKLIPKISIAKFAQIDGSIPFSAKQPYSPSIITSAPLISIKLSANFILSEYFPLILVHFESKLVKRY